MRKITKKMIKESITDMKNIGIELTEIQFLSLMVYDNGLRKDWDEIGDVDTVFRGKILDAIAKDCKMKSCNGFWPTLSVHYITKDSFEIEFKKKAPKRGYILNSNFSIE